MFSARWHKKARDYHKAGKRFLNYKRDIIEPSALEKIQQCLDELKAAIKSKKEDECKRQQAKLDDLCAAASPTPHNVWAENIEVIFVALIIAVSIKSFFTQPFIIPTGSMQPTLNGINGYPKAEEEIAWNPLRRVSEQILFGRKRVDITQKSTKVLIGIKEHSMLNRMWSTLHYADGSKQKLPMPSSALLEDFSFAQKLQNLAAREGKQVPLRSLLYSYKREGIANLPKSITIPEGTLLARGYVSSGDVVLANRMSYHFRAPKRGEVFIFNTKGVGNLEQYANNLGQDAQNYIKRLAGTPGDTLQIFDDDPHLYVNRQKAQEETFQRVASRLETEHGRYTGYLVPTKERSQPELMAQALGGIPIRNELTIQLGQNQYAALGDNSASSQDSRYWGAVDEDNLVGSAMFSIWPLHSHFGKIK